MSRHPKLVLCDILEGWSGEGICGEGIQWKGSHVYLWPIHADAWPKPSQ